MNCILSTSFLRKTAARRRLFRTGYQRMLLWLFLVGTALGAVRAQELILDYAVNRHGKKVGSLQFKQLQDGARTTYAIESLVKVNLLLSVTVQAWEQSVYENSVLQFSSLLRKVNGREREHREIKNTGNNSLVFTSKGDDRQEKKYVVRYSTLCLYAIEPLQYAQVFSDNYQQFLPIQKLGEHHYKVLFPNGSSNEYFYENGVCRKVTVTSTLFDAEFVLQHNKPL